MIGTWIRCMREPPPDPTISDHTNPGQSVTECCKHFTGCKDEHQTGEDQGQAYQPEECRHYKAKGTDTPT